MIKTNLSDDEKQQLIDALNNGVEPTPNLLPKLFPGTAEKFDVAALDRAKVPTLEYAGKRRKAAILAEASAGIGAAPLQTNRCFGKSQDDDWRNLIIQGDNLQFLKTCYRNEDPMIKDKVKGKVDLIYIDPPFGTGDKYEGKDGALSYSAKIEGSEFIEGMRTRLMLLKELLSQDGSIFVRIDYHFGPHLRVVLDEIFGKDNFRNEIVINRFRRQLRGIKQFNIATDSLYLYSKSQTPYFNELTVGRMCTFCKNDKDAEWRGMHSPGLRNPPERIIFGKTYLPPKGRHWSYKQERVEQMEKNGTIRINPDTSYVDLDGARIDGIPEYMQTDDIILDSDWTDIKGYAFASSYPTENTEELLARVIESSCPPNGLVLDVFAGSGTTPATAEKMGRKWIAADFGKHSIYTMQRRMLRIGNTKAISGSEVLKNKHKNDATPFCVVSSGAYDFSHVMDLRKHKDNYINFVLGLFQLTRDDEKSSRYKFANIYAEKDSNPVEVYPVWDDEYLREIRIDEEYLSDIIRQSGGRLKGEYHIITPESCTNVGDTTLKNDEGKDITFKILTFPYKVLEDVSRNLELQDQPSSQDQVNQLISSTAFYFNEDVQIEVMRTDEGLQITKFETKILDKDGNRFSGLTGIAMLLIDDRYEEGKPFDMDKTVFAKDIKEDGSIKLPGLSDSVAVIAIDKHGNESKRLFIK